MNVSHPITAGAAVLLVAALAIPATGEAAPLSTLQVNQVQITGIPLTTIQQSQASFGGTADAAEASRDQVFTVNGTEFTISAYGYASPEALRASSTLSATSAATTFTSHLHMVTAGVTDGVRIDSALYDGQLARFTYTLDVSGMLDTAVDADGFPIAGATARWGVVSGCASLNQCAVGWIGQTATARYEGSLQSPSPGLAFPSGEQPGPLSFTIEAAFGTEILITTLLEVSSQLVFGNGSAGAFATATADFANTLVWGGIQSVSLLDGTPVFDWTTLSGSGFDYGSAAVAPVPLPPTLPMLGTALAGFLAYRRRRRL